MSAAETRWRRTPRLKSVSASLGASRAASLLRVYGPQGYLAHNKQPAPLGPP